MELRHFSVNVIFSRMSASSSHFMQTLNILPCTSLLDKNLPCPLSDARALVGGLQQSALKWKLFGLFFASSHDALPFIFFHEYFTRDFGYSIYSSMFTLFPLHKTWASDSSQLYSLSDKVCAKVDLCSPFFLLLWFYTHRLNLLST